MNSRSEHDPAVVAYRSSLQEVGSLVALLVSADLDPDEDTLPGEDHDHDHDHGEEK
jgi:hypothetical protein